MRNRAGAIFTFKIIGGTTESKFQSSKHFQRNRHKQLMIHLGFFLFIYIAGSLQSIFKHPALIFCVYQCVFFFNPPERWWGSYIPDISYSFYVACILLALAISALLNKKVITNSFNNSIIKTLLVFFIIFTLVYFNAVFADKHIAQVEFFAKSFIIICCGYLLASSIEKLRWYVEAYILGAFYLSFYAYQMGRNSGDRITGIGVLDSTDSNSVAASLAPAAILALHFLFTEKSLIRRVYYAGACVFIANALVIINSRGAMIGIGMGGAFYLYQIYKSSHVVKYAKLKAIGLVFVSLAGVIYVADDSAIERFRSIFEVSAEEDVTKESGATRTHFWEAAIEMSKDYPLGLGFRGFNAYASSYIPEEINTGKSRSRSVHSSWFEALSEVGYIGLVVLLYLIYLSIKLSNSAKNYFKSVDDPTSFLLVIALQASLLSTYVSMSFISRMRGETFMWLLMFIAALYEITKRLQKGQS